MADRAGQQIGAYRLERLLGRGGFAEVYLAQQRYLHTLVAIKLLYARLSPSDQEHFLAEAQIVARLNHPRIVRVLDFAVEEETPYLAMEYAPGGTLRQRHPRGTQLPLAMVIASARQVAEALDYAHAQRLIHRDIKPENLLLRADDTIVLSDFGIATAAHSSRSLMTQDVAGTATYMAPEQFQGKPRPASDQYALGIVVYEWLTGNPPFRGSFLEISGQHLHRQPPPIGERRPDLPARVEEVLLTALAKEPKERFASVQAFADALAQAAQPAPAAIPAERSTLPLAPPEATPPALASATPPAGAQTERVTPAVSPPLPPTVQASTVITASAPPAPAAPDHSRGVPHSPPAARAGGTRGFPRGRLLVAGVSAALLVALLASLSFVFNGYQASVSATRTAGAQQATQTGVLAATYTTVSQTFTAAAGAAYATATAGATQPYVAPVPGPGCDKGGGQWTSVPSPDPGVQCLSDRLRLSGVPDGSGQVANELMFLPATVSFPAKFTASLDVSNIVGSETRVVFNLFANQGAVWLHLTLDKSITLDNSIRNQWFVERSGVQTGIITAPYPDRPVATLLFRLDGLQTSVWVNGSELASFTETAPLDADSIGVLLTSPLTGAQVDLQNLVITPLL